MSGPASAPIEEKTNKVEIAPTADPKANEELSPSAAKDQIINLILDDPELRAQVEQKSPEHKALLDIAQKDREFRQVFKESFGNGIGRYDLWIPAVEESARVFAERIFGTPPDATERTQGHYEESPFASPNPGRAKSSVDTMYGGIDNYKLTDPNMARGALEAYTGVLASENPGSGNSARSTSSTPSEAAASNISLTGKGDADGGPDGGAD